MVLEVPWLEEIPVKCSRFFCIFFGGCLFAEIWARILGTLKNLPAPTPMNRTFNTTSTERLQRLLAVFSPNVFYFADCMLFFIFDLIQPVVVMQSSILCERMGLSSGVCTKHKDLLRKKVVHIVKVYVAQMEKNFIWRKQKYLGCLCWTSEFASATFVRYCTPTTTDIVTRVNDSTQSRWLVNRPEQRFYWMTPLDSQSMTR